MADISSLSYPNKSHRKKAHLPKECEDLAEFFGIMMGDGGINNSWQANISLNSEADIQYVKYVCDLITKLFHIKPSIYQHKKRRVVRRILLSQVSDIFEEFSIVPHISNRGRSIYLYKANAVAAYLDTFGSSNERILKVYREFGSVA